jgi:hypothetical protein
LLLTAYGQLWDAEVLIRSVAEGSFKFCYLLQNRESWKQRHHEYSHDLWQIALFKDHKKASDLLAALPNPDDPKWQPIRDRLLSNEDRDQIDRDYTRGQRRALDARWSFTGLIGEFVRSGDIIFSSFAGFAHGYSLASHIQHVDYVGASLPLERDRRSDERRTSIQLAHAMRLISDAFTFLHLRLMVGYRFVAHDSKPVAEARRTVEELLISFGTVYEDWIAIEYPKTKVPPEI